MKNRKCPYHKSCWDYGNCEDCELGKEITRLHKRIDRLKKQNETLTIQRNAWALAAKRVLEDGKWISVDERMPDPYINCIIVVKTKYAWENKWNYDTDTALYIDEGEWETWNDWDEGNQVVITHWMPFPEPPKESEDTE